MVLDLPGMRGRMSRFAMLLAIFLYVVTTSGEAPCPKRPIAAETFEANKGNDIFYVDASNGDDAWAGTALEPTGQGNGPFQTLSGAISGMRQQRGSTDDKATLYVRGGTHFITSRISMDGRDSKLSIVGYPGDETPIISGASVIQGSDFLPFDQVAYVATFNGRCSKHAFLGNKRLYRARKPSLQNWDGNELMGEGPYLIIKDLLMPTSDCDRAGSGGFRQNNCPDRNKDGFVYEAGDIIPSWYTSSLTDKPEIIVFHAWVAERGVVSNITSDKVFFNPPLRFPVGRHPQPSGYRYIVENVFQELDAEGEFFCDGDLGRFYIVPPDGESPTEDVYVSQETEFFRVSGATEISFIDLDFRHSSDRGIDGFNNRPAVLDFTDCDEITVYRCRFRHLGHTAIFAEESNNLKFSYNEILDVGYFGIGTEFSNSADSNNLYNNENILIDKNTIKGCGVSNMLQPACMLIKGSRNVHITRNDISYSSYAGIRAGWHDTFASDYVTGDHKVYYIKYNHVYNYGCGILNDFGGIYLSSNQVCGSAERDLNFCFVHALIYKNTIYNSRAFFYGSLGVFGDTGASGMTVERNWLYDLTDCPINFHCGLNNKAINNMIYHTNSNRVFGTCKSIGPGTIPRQTMSIVDNVIYIANSNARMYSPSDFWTNDVPLVENNVYFFNPFSQANFDNFFPKSRTWDLWRSETGNDAKSIIKDPSFRSIEDDDYRLNCTSPARDLGIKSVDLRHVRFKSGACN